MPETTETIEFTLDEAIHFREAGRLEESRRILELLIAQALGGNERSGYDHQCAISQLGRTLRAMGRAEEASALHWEALAIRLELHGRRGDYTQNSARILAETLRDFLHDTYMAAAVESWFAEPEGAIEVLADGEPLTVSRLQQIIREHAAATAGIIADLFDEYLQEPPIERLREPSQAAW
jgi:hypothetical protein